MNNKFRAALLLSAFGFRCLAAEGKPLAAAPHAASAPAVHAYFIDPAVLDLAIYLTPPPASGSEITKHELVELHRVEATRTPQQVAAAKADDKEEDIFIFRDVLGKEFNAESLPLTAELS